MLKELAKKHFNLIEKEEYTPEQKLACFCMDNYTSLWELYEKMTVDKKDNWFFLVTWRDYPHISIDHRNIQGVYLKIDLGLTREGFYQIVLNNFSWKLYGQKKQ